MILSNFRLIRMAFVLTCAITAGVYVAHAADRTLYVDCSRAQNGDGSLQAPWNSLEALNAVLLQPGDTVHLRRGTVCHGVLSPQGSGQEGRPIRLTAYGEGPRPQVVAGTKPEEALRLFNQQYWNIDSLDISGGTTYGIFISGDNGILHHIHLFNLAVHDVLGSTLNHKESGLVSISPSSAKSHFDDVLVDGVNAWHTNQWVGILIGGGNLGFPPESDWNTNAIIRNSTVHDVQGDGIVLFRVRNGLIDSSVAWNIGMQDTQTIGTPNAIWTWMCDDCTVQRSEAYLTDSPGVDGGAFDIDYGNTKNSVIDNYGHDTQGYCVAVFGAGFVTRDSVVRGNLCINNGRSPRMADYQGAIFLWTWNGGSIDGLTVEKNAIYWSPFENVPALLNKATIKPGTATFRDNNIVSTAPWMVESNTAISLAGNSYEYFGSASPKWQYGGVSYASLHDLQSTAKQENGGNFRQRSLRDRPQVFLQRDAAQPAWTLECVLPISLDAAQLMSDSTLQEIVLLKSLSQQYAAQGLKVSVELTSADPKLFGSAAFRNALTDLNLRGVTMTHRVTSDTAMRIALRGPDGARTSEWTQPVGPVPLGLALRKVFGEPVYAQMNVGGRE